ncbi:hypothetical protein DSL72_008796 [Monilinia vaccinii-corymbosi]|uniref:Uncharacterized protein n=1 Tax=Monilinia vaccinii-corymbosi TaxID=61207 RepID=A0A8A3PQ90_9HELO|nr:hypothetical protein DSL72_008796 [Monilinia vaccinii-corymbosi]
MPEQNTTVFYGHSTRKIPSKVCAFKPQSRAIKPSGARDDKAREVGDEESSSDSEKSVASTCPGDCGKIGGCGRKEKIASLEF